MTLTTRRDFISLCSAAVATSGGAVGRDDALTRRTEFPALRQRVHDQPLIYLDSAATTLRPQAVIDALVDYYSTDNANPSKVHTLAARAAARLDDARQAAARFINAASPTEIIFTRGTTEGINLIASTWGVANLAKGDEIVLSIAEHNSNLMPWTRAAERAGAVVRVADVDDDGRLTPESIKAVLSERTKLVAFSHVSNVLGIVNPVREITRAAKASRATVVIDGAKGAQQLTVDVRDIGCDGYVFSGHKILGPMGTGVTWVRQAILDHMPPYHVGSNMAHGVSFDHAEYESGALKYQAGTPDVAGSVGLAAAMRLIDRIGYDAIRRHDEALVTHAAGRFRELRHVRLIGSIRPNGRAPVFTFTIPGVTANAVASSLDGRGIAVRAG